MFSITALLALVGCLSAGCDVNLNRIDNGSEDFDAWTAVARQFEESRAAGDAASCEKYLLKLHKISEKLADQGRQDLLAQSSLFLGAFYCDNERLEQAKAYLELAVQLCGDHQLDPLLAARCEGCYGKVLNQLGEPENALPQFLSSAGYFGHEDTELDEDATIMYLEVLSCLTDCQVQLEDSHGLLETTSLQLDILLYLEAEPNLVARSLSLFLLAAQDIGATDRANEAIEMLEDMFADDLISDPAVLEVLESTSLDTAVEDGDTSQLIQLSTKLEIETSDLSVLEGLIANEIQEMHFDQLVELQADYRHYARNYDAAMQKSRGQRNFLNQTSGTLGAQGVQAVYITPQDAPPTHCLEEMERLRSSFNRTVERMVKATGR